MMARRMDLTADNEWRRSKIFWEDLFGDRVTADLINPSIRSLRWADFSVKNGRHLV
jgi:hypothetical protein